jgi:quinol monooxygenase YgiN
MSIVVLLDFRVKPEALEESLQLFKKILPDTRAYLGCEGVDVYNNADDPTNIIFYERWKSKELYQKYLAWRTETGFMESFGAKLAGAPTIRYFDRQEV